MAQITFSPIISEARGQIGKSQIFSRNRGGSYVKQYASPVQPGSSAQLQARDIFQLAVSRWSAFPESDKQKWDSLAESYGAKNKVSAHVQKSGRSLFISRSMEGYQTSFGFVPQPIFPEKIFKFNQSFTITAPDQFIYSNDVVGTHSNFYMLFYFSAPQPISVRSFNTAPISLVTSLSPLRARVNYNYYSIWQFVTGHLLISGEVLFCRIKGFHIPSSAKVYEAQLRLIVQ